MTTLYNCHTEGHGYRITKFDTLGNVESSYSCTKEICECPAGHRHTCRHREMLRIFLRQKAVDTHQFYNYDRGEWVTNEPEAGFDTEMQAALEADGAKLKQLTGEDHGPVFLDEPPGGEAQPDHPHHPAIEPVTLHDEPAVIITKPEPTPIPFKRRI